MAAYTTGQRQQINFQAKSCARSMEKDLKDYIAARTDIRRRTNKRALERQFSDSDSILRRAEAVGLNGEDVKRLRDVDTAARRKLGKPPRTPATPSGAAAPPSGAPTAPFGGAAASRAARAQAAQVRARKAALLAARKKAAEAAKRRAVTAARRARTRRAAPPRPYVPPRTTAQPPYQTPYQPAQVQYPTQSDAYMQQLPQLQSAAAQGTMTRIIQQRDQMIQMIAAGQMSAAQAENTLANTLNTGEGSAIVAQDQASAQAWLDDAVNAFYQTEQNVAYAQQSAAYAPQGAAYAQQEQYNAYQQAQYAAYQQDAEQPEDDAEFVYEDEAPEDMPEEEEAPEEDTAESVKAEYDAEYDMGMGAAYTTGQRREINTKAKLIRRALESNMGQYNRAVLGWVRREQKRDLERILRESDGVLRQAEAVGLHGEDTTNLARVDRSARALIGAPPRTPVTPAAQTSRAVPRHVPTARRAVPTPRRSADEARRLAQARASADRWRQVAQQAVQRAAAHDARLASMPHMQSPAGQGAVRTLVAYRNTLQQQVAQGAMPAATAKAELFSMLASGTGSAVVAQDPDGAAEWQKASEEALDKTEGAKVEAEVAAEVEATEAPVESKGKVLVPALVLAAVGGGLGYAVAEDEDEQGTYAAIGGVVGGLLGLIGGKIMKRRAEAKAAEE